MVTKKPNEIVVFIAAESVQVEVQVLTIHLQVQQIRVTELLVQDHMDLANQIKEETLQGDANSVNHADLDLHVYVHETNTKTELTTNCIIKEDYQIKYNKFLRSS